MKGPGFRLDLDPRRTWECPRCGKRLRFDGRVTSVLCECSNDDPPQMRLVERLRRTDSPFDHVGYAAQKRIDAALKKCQDESDLAPLEDGVGEVCESEEQRPEESQITETTHAIDSDAPPPTVEEPPPGDVARD